MIRFISYVSLFIFVIAAVTLVGVQRTNAFDPYNVQSSDGSGSTVCSSSSSAAKGSAVCQPNSANSTTIFGKNGVFTRVTNLVLVMVGLISVIVIMIGGFQYITSTGDSQKVDSAKNTILYAIIGLVVAVIARGIIAFGVNLIH